MLLISVTKKLAPAYAKRVTLADNVKNVALVTPVYYVMFVNLGTLVIQTAKVCS